MKKENKKKKERKKERKERKGKPLLLLLLQYRNCYPSRDARNLIVAFLQPGRLLLLYLQTRRPHDIGSFSKK